MEAETVVAWICRKVLQIVIKAGNLAQLYFKVRLSISDVEPLQKTSPPFEKTGSEKRGGGGGFPHEKRNVFCGLSPFLCHLGSYFAPK